MAKKELSKQNLVFGMVFVLVAGLLIGYFMHTLKAPRQKTREDFKTMSLEEMREHYITERSYAIEKAEKAGLYDCCIEPACTMCLDHGTDHPWTTPGSGRYCDCDTLLEQGKDPCPQCRAGLAEGRGEPVGE